MAKEPVNLSILVNNAEDFRNSHSYYPLTARPISTRLSRSSSLNIGKHSPRQVNNLVLDIGSDKETLPSILGDRLAFKPHTFLRSHDLETPPPKSHSRTANVAVTATRRRPGSADPRFRKINKSYSPRESTKTKSDISVASQERKNKDAKDVNSSPSISQETSSRVVEIERKTNHQEVQTTREMKISVHKVTQTETRKPVPLTSEIPDLRDKTEKLSHAEVRRRSSLIKNWLENASELFRGQTPNKQSSVKRSRSVGSIRKFGCTERDLICDNALPKHSLSKKESKEVLLRVESNTIKSDSFINECIRKCSLTTWQLAVTWMVAIGIATGAVLVCSMYVAPLMFAHVVRPKEEISSPVANVVIWVLTVVRQSLEQLTSILTKPRKCSISLFDNDPNCH